MKDGKDDDRARLYLQLAAEDLNKKEYSHALDNTFKSLEFNPNYAAAYNQLALVYMETKRFDKADEAFKKALEIRSDYPEVFNNIGVLRNRQQKYQEAIPYFRKALADERYVTPENALTNMGQSYYKLGEISKARKYHHQALDIMPSFCLANKNLADTYAKQKDYDKSSKYYEQAVTHCPLYQESHYKLGLALMKAGRKRLAQQQLEKLVLRHKNGPYVERSEKVLKYLQN